MRYLNVRRLLAATNISNDVVLSMSIYCVSYSQRRSYCTANAGSHLNSKAKKCKARWVLGWGTARETRGIDVCRSAFHMAPPHSRYILYWTFRSVPHKNACDFYSPWNIPIFAFKRDIPIFALGTFRFLPSERTFRFLPSEGTFRFLPSEGTFRFLPSEGTFRFLPSEGTFRFLPSEGTFRFLPSEGTFRFLL